MLDQSYSLCTPSIIPLWKEKRCSLNIIPQTTSYLFSSLNRLRQKEFIVDYTLVRLIYTKLGSLKEPLLRIASPVGCSKEFEHLNTTTTTTQKEQQSLNNNNSNLITQFRPYLRSASSSADPPVSRRRSSSNVNRLWQRFGSFSSIGYRSSSSSIVYSNNNISNINLNNNNSYGINNLFQERYCHLCGGESLTHCYILQQQMFRYHMEKNLADKSEDDNEIDNRSILHYELGFYEKTLTSCFRGILTFSLRYDFIHRAIMLHVIRANQLTSTDEPPNPYIKMYFLPERRHHCKTKIFKKCRDAEFNEMFSFEVPYNQLANRMLQFTVYDFDRFSRHGLIGNVIMRDLFERSNLIAWTEYTMQIVGNQEKNDYGDLLLYFAYSINFKKLYITVSKAYNLRPMDITGASDPYVKIEQIYQRKRVKARKTTIKRANLNPVYHECLEFDLLPEQIEKTNFLVQVMDWDRIGRDDLLGCCVIGKDSPTKEGRQQWEETFQRLRMPRRSSNVIQNGTNNATTTTITNQHLNDVGNISPNLLLLPTTNALNHQRVIMNGKNNNAMHSNGSKKDKTILTTNCHCQSGTNDAESPKPVGTWHSILGELPDDFRNITKAKK